MKDSAAQSNGVSTLLIPTQHLELLDQACANHGINVLIGKMMVFALVPCRISSTIVRTKYQDDGLGLIRCCFRVTDTTWYQLGQLARLYGVSRCRMFIILLIAWSNRMSKLQQPRRPRGQWVLTEYLSLQAFPGIRTTTLAWKTAPDG